MKIKSVVGAVLISFVLSLLPTPASGASFVEIPRDSANQFALELCASPEHLTCIESITAILPNGTTNPFQLLSTKKVDYRFSPVRQGQSLDGWDATWSFTDVDGSNRTVHTTSMVRGEKFRSAFSPPDSKWYDSAMSIDFQNLLSKDVSSGIKFKVVIRSSWFKPALIAPGMVLDDWMDETINGVRRFSFTGSPMSRFTWDLTKHKRLELLDEAESQLSKSDGEINVFGVYMIHQSPGNEIFWPCWDLGYWLLSTNSNLEAEPKLIDSETLHIVVSAPHLKSTGEINTGSYDAFLGIAYLNCKFPGNNLTKSSKIEVSVVNTDGTSQLATVSTKVANGFLEVHARNFHYSSATVVIKAIPNLDLPQIPKIAEAPIVSEVPTVAKANVIAAKKTITCTKGKLTKKVTSVNPKCPTGYKKK